MDSPLRQKECGRIQNIWSVNRLDMGESNLNTIIIFMLYLMILFMRILFFMRYRIMKIR